MKEPTEMGWNRTGLGTSPIDGKALVEAAERTAPSPPGDESELARARRSYVAESGVIGTMPPPATVKGAVRTIVESISGDPLVFLDKLGERLGFERTGVRLYDALLAKYDARGSWDGGPTRELLTEFRDEELEHAHLIRNAIASMGADPTALSPSADLTAVEAMGLVQAITDPRTTLAQSLHAMLVAELADNEAWDMLADLATELGHEAMGDDFRDALRAEERHLAHVRQWVAHFTSRSAQGEVLRAA